MVRAILEGRKTQTRRVAQQQPERIEDIDSREALRRFGQPGDRLWVRETWIYRGVGWTNQKRDVNTLHAEFAVDGARRSVDVRGDYEHLIPKQPERGVLDDIEWDRTLSRWWSRKRPGIHMPRWASRLTLEVTGVRVERLTDITEEDAKAEGVDAINGPWGRVPVGDGSHRDAFRLLWNENNGMRGFRWLSSQKGERGPWVWVVEFRRVEP